MLELISRIARWSSVSAESSTIADNRAVVAPHDAPIARGIFDFGGKNRRGGAGFPVRARQRGERFRADQRRIARQQDGELRARGNRAPRHQHRVARAALRLLQHCLHAQRRDRGGHILGLMAHDRDNFSRLERQARAHNVLDQRTPARAVQHLRQRGFEPRALARGQDHDYEVGSCHTSIVSGSRQFDNKRE